MSALCTVVDAKSTLNKLRSATRVSGTTAKYDFGLTDAEFTHDFDWRRIAYAGRGFVKVAAMTSLVFPKLEL